MAILSFILLEGTLLDVNPGTIVWTLVTFLLLLLILGKTAWKPIISALSDREKKIAKAIEDANEASRKAMNANKQSIDIIKHAQDEANAIVQDARHQAEKMRQDIEQKSKVEAKDILDHAKREIENVKEKARQELRQEVVGLSIKGAEMLLKAELDMSEEKQKEILRSFIAELPIFDKKSQDNLVFRQRK